MPSNLPNNIPDIVIGRLPIYLRATDSRKRVMKSHRRTNWASASASVQRRYARTYRISVALENKARDTRLAIFKKN